MIPTTMPCVRTNENVPHRAEMRVEYDRREAHADAPRQDRAEMRVRLAKGRSDLGVRRGDGKGEDRVEEKAPCCQRGDGQCERDEDRTAHDVELLPVQHVQLDVEHRHPDPHGRQDLHQGQPPVDEERLEPLEEHEEGAHDQGERRQPASRTAQVENGLPHRFLVAGLDEPDQLGDRAEHPLAALSICVPSRRALVAHRALGRSDAGR